MEFGVGGAVRFCFFEEEVIH